MFKSKTKIRLVDIVIVSLLVVVLAFIAIIIYSEYSQKQVVSSIDENLKLKTDKEKIISYARGIDPDTQTEIISYIYTTENIVLSDIYEGHQEDVGKRSNNSRAYKKPSDDPEIENYVAKFYAGHPFQLDDGVWKETENATTTVTAFLLQTENTPLDKIRGLLGQPVFAADDTTFSGVGDGYVALRLQATWDLAHDTEVGEIAYDTDDIIGVGGGNWTGYFMYRSFFPFYTDHLESGVIIASASLYVKPVLAVDSTLDGYGFLTIVETTQASNTSLDVSDFNKSGLVDGAIEGIDIGARIYIDDVIPGEYISFPLNSTGISWISTTGYTKLGVREGHDLLDIPANLLSDVIINSSESPTTDNDPYLEISYSITKDSAKVKLDGSKLQIDSGQLKIN
jgi:hypothetical protein